MKNGTMYAARLKKAYAKIRQAASQPDIPELDEPLRRLAVAILGVQTSEEEASRALDRAFDHVVDWNELRVSSAKELNKATGNVIPHGVERCQKLIGALQAIYDNENRLSLDHLRNLGRRDARHYLERLDGVDAYAVASVVLWSLGGHAIPVDDRLLEALRRADLVNPNADRSEVQAFLERHISATDAKAFCLIMRGYAPKKASAKSAPKTKAAGKKKRSTSKAK
ncbi:MAG: hypothetical protein PVI86_09965 [Phycisphaerae bacterium]|jgi:endonuclease III